MQRIDRSFDVVREIAGPLPLATIMEIIGVPGEDCGEFRQHTTTFVDALGNPAERQRDASAAVDRLKHLVAKAWQRPDLQADSLLGLVRSEGLAIGPTIEDLVSNIILLIEAGHRTTTALIGSGVFLLLRYADQGATVIQRNGWLSAVDEVLRFESPVRSVHRVAIRQFELDRKSVV